MNFIFNKGVDLNNNVYTNAYFNEDVNGIVSIDGKNTVFKGNPKIVTRTGSVFGDELLIQFLIKGKINEYPSSSKHEVLEIYLPKEKGIEFLEKTLRELKGMQID